MAPHLPPAVLQTELTRRNVLWAIPPEQCGTTRGLHDTISGNAGRGQRSSVHTPGAAHTVAPTRKREGSQVTTDQKERDLQEIGKNAYEGIAEMVAALECNYDRLEEMKEERADLASEVDQAVRDRLVGDDLAEVHSALSEWDAENGEELKELVAAAGDCESQEDAAQRIQEDPLSVEVRSGWTTVGEPMEAEGFTILLGTGGPAVRIRGELGPHNQPSRAWIEAQDWFTPWTEYTGSYDGGRYMETLLTYCQQFYFGD